MNRHKNFNLPWVVTEYVGATLGAIHKTCFRDWISQSQNATEKVLLWRSYQLPKQENI